MGIRPLCLGKLNGGWIVASETCALDHLGATFVRELEPGEALVVDGEGLHSSTWTGSQGRRALCVFELIYFSRPDSIIDNTLVHSVRQELGAQLAREHPVDADLVIGIPDSSIAAAVGYAQESGIHYSEGLIKNRYVGRTFIEPAQSEEMRGRPLISEPLIEVDGGVNPDNAQEIVQAGGNILVAATAIFKHPNGIGGGIRSLRQCAENPTMLV